MAFEHGHGFTESVNMIWHALDLNVAVPVLKPVAPHASETKVQRSTPAGPSATTSQTTFRDDLLLEHERILNHDAITSEVTHQMSE